MGRGGDRGRRSSGSWQKSGRRDKGALEVPKQAKLLGLGCRCLPTLTVGQSSWERRSRRVGRAGHVGGHLGAEPPGFKCLTTAPVQGLLIARTQVPDNSPSTGTSDS